MALKLSVPNLSTRLLSEIELDPAKVEKWLDGLPLLNLVETSQKILSTLMIYNRIELENDRRLKLFELFRSPIKQLSFELKKQYIGQPLPLPEKYKNASEKNQQFQVEMAYGYKRAILNTEPPSRPENNPGRKVSLAFPIQRAIYYLTECLMASYQSYAPYPQATWVEIHTLYRHAESIGVVNVDVVDPFNQTLGKTSVSHVYKRALLMGLSNPRHLTARMVDKIAHYLDRWASLPVLLPATVDFDPTCQFLIDQYGDRAGILYTGDISLEKPEQYRLLNTVELARRIHGHLTALQQGRQPDPEGLDPQFFNEDSHELLLRLIHAWGVHPRRSFRRSIKAGEEINLAIGLRAINYWVNNGERFLTSATFMGPQPRRTSVVDSNNNHRNTETEEFEYSTWTVQDESAGGLSLLKNGFIKSRVRVGDLVATKKPNAASPWEISVIRWVKSASPSNLEIGTQRLAPNAEPVVIKTYNEDNKESDFLPALLLPEIKPLKQTPTLITHRGVHQPKRVIYMDNGRRLIKIILIQLIELTNAYERFTFRIGSS
jgi:cyclic-di-GMP-binding protein